MKRAPKVLVPFTEKQIKDICSTLSSLAKESAKLAEFVIALLHEHLEMAKPALAAEKRKARRRAAARKAKSNAATLDRLHDQEVADRNATEALSDAVRDEVAAASMAETESKP